MVGLGGCPVAVTVYPPGRGCLHSALLSKSSGCVEYPSTERQVELAGRLPLKTASFSGQEQDEKVFPDAFSFEGDFINSCPHVATSFMKSPSPSKEKAQAFRGGIHVVCFTQATVEGGRNGSLLKRFAAASLLYPTSLLNLNNE